MLRLCVSPTPAGEEVGRSIEQRLLPEGEASSVTSIAAPGGSSVVGRWGEVFSPVSIVAVVEWSVSAR